MLLKDDRSSLFYSDPDHLLADEPPEQDAAPGRGLAGRLLTRWHRFQETFRQADAGVMGWCRRIWVWLHSRTQPDEPLLFRLRTTNRLDLHHPLSQSGAETSMAWQAYLTGRRRRHAIRMIANSLIAPIAGLLLFPLPGPNLIGYWFAYRAIHHTLLIGGIRRALGGKIPITYHPESWLDLRVEGDPWGRRRPAA